MEDRHSEKIRLIGLRIAYFRRIKRLTQEELAHRVCINKNYLSRIECGLGQKTISLPLLFDLAEALGISLSLLVNCEDLEHCPHDQVTMQSTETLGDGCKMATAHDSA